MRSLALAAVLSVVGLVFWSGTQTSVGTVSGTVKGSAGAPAAGARIQLTARNAAPLIRISDAHGAFSFETRSEPQEVRADERYR